MTVSRPQTLRIGDEVLLPEQMHVVEGMADGDVRLLDVVGGLMVMPLSRLLTDFTFRNVAAAPPAPQAYAAWEIGPEERNIVLSRAPPSLL